MTEYANEVSATIKRMKKTGIDVANFPRVTVCFGFDRVVALVNLEDGFTATAYATRIDYVNGVSPKTIYTGESFLEALKSAEKFINGKG